MESLDVSVRAPAVPQFSAKEPDGEKPATVSIVPNRYFRFGRPGHYRLYATSHRVEPLPVPRSSTWPRTTTASEIVEFDILPADPVWERSQLAAIREDLDSPDPPDRTAAVTDLRYLATDDAAREMLSRLKSAPEDGGGLIEGLYEARDRSFVLGRMKEALADPDFAVSAPLLDALVRLDIPALDPILKRSYVPNDGTQLAHNQVILGLLARYASRSLLPFAQSLYPHFQNPPEQAYLLAYFLRVDGARGRKLVDGILSRQSREQKTCYLLQELADAIPGPAVERTVRAHLGDKDPNIAADARTALHFLPASRAAAPRASVSNAGR